MKKSFSIVLLSIVVCFTACKKSYSDKPTTYSVDVKDITLSSAFMADVWVDYDIKCKGPIQENVSVSIEGLPQGVIIDTTGDHIANGVPGFTAGLRLINNNITNKKGTYKVKLVCEGSVTGRKEIPLNLIIMSDTAINPGSKVNIPSEADGRYHVDVQNLVGIDGAQATTAYLRTDIQDMPRGFLTFVSTGDRVIFYKYDARAKTATACNLEKFFNERDIKFELALQYPNPNWKHDTRLILKVKKLIRGATNYYEDHGYIVLDKE